MIHSEYDNNITMNLFDANIQSSFNNFIGKQAPPPVPSFGSTQAPQTTNSTQPIGTPAKRISTGFVPGYE